MDFREFIVANGEIEIDSVFRFEDNPESLGAFIRECEEKKCTVRFKNEELIYRPYENLRPEFKVVGDSSVFQFSIMTYMWMHKEYFVKHMEYKVNLEKNDEWIKTIRGE